MEPTQGWSHDGSETDVDVRDVLVALERSELERSERRRRNGERRRTTAQRDEQPGAR